MQLVAGFVWKRQPQIRITKDFSQNLWVSLSAEEPQNTFAGCATGVNATAVAAATGGVANAVTCDLLGTGGLNGVTPTVGGVAGVSNTTPFSLNHVPDVIGKVAYEARFADRDVHLEGFGMYRDFYDRAEFVNPLTTFAQAGNHDTTGYGFGGGVIVPVLPRRLDFQASGLTGKGIGSYGSAQFSDATFAANGAASPIQETMLLGGLTLHATPAIDLYAFGGEEVVQPNYFTTSAAGAPFTGFGYGVPTANNSGCFNTVTVGTCGGSAKRVWELTGGMWDKIYKGSFGEIRVGVQYSYIQRELFQGSGGGPIPSATAPLNFAPKQNENTVMASLRYYPFQ